MSAFLEEPFFPEPVETLVGELCRRLGVRAVEKRQAELLARRGWRPLHDDEAAELAAAGDALRQLEAQRPAGPLADHEITKEMP